MGSVESGPIPNRVLSPQIVATNQARSAGDTPVDEKLRALMQFVSQIGHAACPCYGVSSGTGEAADPRYG